MKGNFLASAGRPLKPVKHEKCFSLLNITDLAPFCCDPGWSRTATIRMILLLLLRSTIQHSLFFLFSWMVHVMMYSNTSSDLSWLTQSQLVYWCYGQEEVAQGNTLIGVGNCVLERAHEGWAHLHPFFSTEKIPSRNCNAIFFVNSFMTFSWGEILKLLSWREVEEIKFFTLKEKRFFSPATHKKIFNWHSKRVRGGCDVWLNAAIVSWKFLSISSMCATEFDGLCNRTA